MSGRKCSSVGAFSFVTIHFVVCCLSVVSSEKYKLCVVDGRGGFKRSGKFCPILDKPDSKVECVLGIDRLDCLRRISKGKVDFSVFTPEDLVTATNSEIEVLITNQLRYTAEKYEYEVVAVISNSAGIASRHDLKDKRFCHPGYGYEADWTRILSNYLEASIVPQSCDPKYTLTENRIRASSAFFHSACKAGPWVNNPSQDLELKQKYPNLCKLCDIPSKCSMQDKYWGRRGPLFCLTDGAGDISWARLDDVRPHFGITPGGMEASPDDYSLLCPDGRIVPVNTTNPCVWVVKPWPVIATKRTSAQDIQQFIASLSHNDGYSWQSALLSLIQTYHLSINELKPLQSIEGYLDSAVGFLNANSFTGCHPPRTIRVCTTSVVENYKCAWLRESAAVYGIEPDLDCLLAANITECMQAVKHNFADVVMVEPDQVYVAIMNYNLKSLFYETVNNDEKYLTVAITRNTSRINNLQDLRGKRACFPVYNGIAWRSTIHALHTNNLFSDCSADDDHHILSNFFGPSCVSQLPQNKSSSSLRAICDGNRYDGEIGAIKCLKDGIADVAFVSKNSLIKFVHDSIYNEKDQMKMSDFKFICPEETLDGCHLSWAPLGYGMVRAQSSDLWSKDTLDVFMQLDGLFGKSYKSLTVPLQLFGPFDGKPNLLFHDSTVRLRDVPTSRNTDIMVRPYEDILQDKIVCMVSAAVPSGLDGRLFSSAVTILPVVLFLTLIT